MAARAHWGEAQTAGALTGTKTVLNELVAYLDLARLPKDALSGAQHGDHDLCPVRVREPREPRDPDRRFGTMVPDRRAEVIALGPKSIVSETLKTLMTNAIVGVLWS